MPAPRVKVTEAQCQDAITVILSDKPAYEKSLNWAVNYCRAAQGLSGEELRVQCLYILNNISKWRHPRASEVRATLRAFSQR
jgi:hypothetical protein